MADDDVATGDGTGQQQDDTSAATADAQTGQSQSRGRGGDKSDEQNRSATPKRLTGDHDSESDDEANDEKTEKRFTQADIDKAVKARLDREAKKYADYSDLKKAAGELQKLKDAEKTESQRLSDQLAETEVELQQLRVEKIRNQAGHEAGLDPDLWEYITASDPEDALVQAQKLVEKTKPLPPKAAKTEQGARTAPRAASNPNDVLRAMAERST